MKCDIDILSGLRGILTMKLKRRPRHPGDYKKAIEMKRAGIIYGARWFVDWGRFGWGAAFWTPVWHEGRGPYLTLLLGICRITRGY
jgi:hypothetical protein